DMNAQMVTLFRGPERPRFSRHETREQPDEPQGQDHCGDRRQPRPGPRARRSPGGPRRQGDRRGARPGRAPRGAAEAGARAGAAAGAGQGILADVRPEVLVLNAGAKPRMGRLDQLSWADFTATWETDVKAGLYWMQAALNLPLAPGARVLVGSSGAAQQGSP